MTESAVFSLINKLVLLLQEEVTLLSGVREEAQYIRDELERMTAFLRVADSLIEETDLEIEVWVKQVRNVVYDAEDVLDLLLLQLAHRQYGNRFYGYFHGFLRTVKNLKARRQIASKIQSIKARVIDIADRHQRYRLKFNRLEQHQGLATTSTMVNNTRYDPRGDALFLKETELVGIDNSKQQLIQWLVEGDSGLQVVSVAGMGGLGKTTLVKKVYDDPKVQQHFQIHAWISVSESFNAGLLLKDMINQFYAEMRQPVPPQIETMNINNLTQEIKQFLQRKRHLVVLDDVWKIEAWDSVKHALPDNNCGSRVMLTTRISSVASTCCTETDGKVYSLKPLSEKESWTLFCNKAFRRNPCPQHLEEICRNIMKRCEGLPLGIVTIGGVLARKDTSRADQWEVFYQSLSSELEGNSQLERVKKLLSLSYYDLPYYLKICFLYLSIFPEDHEIEHMRLVRLWTAEGFVQMRGGIAIEDVAEGYLNELVERSLIQVAKAELDGRIRICRVHDLLREIILSKSRKQNIVTIYNEGLERLSEKVRRLSIHHTMGDNIQGSEHFSQLRSLLMFGMKDTPSILVNGELKLLKVLDLRGADLETFPNEIVRLFHLRYLSLRDTKVNVLPKSIGNLVNLETLDLKQTLVTELPEGILKLQKLRHLLVYRYDDTSYSAFTKQYGFRAPVKLSSLTSLQKLCNIDASHCSNVVREVRMLTQLRRLTISNFRREDGMAMCSSLQKMTNLRSLGIVSVNEDEIIDVQHPLSPAPRFLQKLYLKGRLEKLPHWIPSLHGLVRVHLRWSKLIDDPLQSLEDLPNLSELELHRAYEGEGLFCKARRFQRLKILRLYRLEGLRWVTVEEGAMPHLEDLSIHYCELVEEAPSGIEHLTRLKMLGFFNMPDKFIRRIEGDGGVGAAAVDYWRIAHIPRVWVGSYSDDGIKTGRYLKGEKKIKKEFSPGLDHHHHHGASIVFS